MLNLAFWKAALERTGKTFAQTLAALLVADGTGLLNSAWGDRLSVAGMAALVSVLTSVGSYGVNGTASAIAAEVPVAAPPGKHARPDEPIPGTTLYSSDPKSDAAHHDGTG